MAILYIGPQIVPLRAIPSQITNITLGNQPCTIKVQFKNIQIPMASAIVTDPPVFEIIQPCFLDLYVNDALIIGGVRCMNNTRIVRNAYLGFIGDLAFEDLQGTDDPTVEGLGSRFLLTYWAGLV